jgi:predicted 2-oxoglutarate/Fe(II)-dependent dioxygenase YbiX
LSEYQEALEWREAATVGDKVKGETEALHRKCDVISMSHDLVKNISSNRQNLDEATFKELHEVLKSYCETMNTDVWQDEGFNLLRYNTGGYYKLHVDTGPKDVVGSSRNLSITVVLNDDFEGGEFVFFEDQKKVVKPSKGQVIVFPSNFMFPHEVCEVTKGTRYSIVTWVQ